MLHGVQMRLGLSDADAPARRFGRAQSLRLAGSE